MKRRIILSTLLLSGCVSINKTYWLLRNDIANHKWHVPIHNKALPSSATFTLSKNVKYSGTFSGFGGCNKYSGKYYATSYSISFKLTKVGNKNCFNLYKEKEFLKNILRTKRMYIKDNKLIFVSKNHDKLMELER